MRALIRSVTAFAALSLTTLTPAVRSSDQLHDSSGVSTPDEYAVDLSLTGAMADVLSNALTLDYGVDELAATAFLTASLERLGQRSDAGAELLTGAATTFSIDRDALADAVETRRHVNCSHPGGGAESTGTPPTDQSGVESLDQEFATSVLHHVVLHELAHALVREFDLPVLANEETLADAFATHHLVTHSPERAPTILRARVESLMVEARAVPRAEWSVTGEHNSDARRAYQIAALAIAEDPQVYGFLAPLVGMNDAGVRRAVDYGAELHRSWRRVLRPLRMPEDRRSSEVRVDVSEDSIVDALVTTRLLADLESTLRTFDWHSQIVLRFQPGPGGASWSRSRRTITVHDQVIKRYARQGRELDRSTMP